MTPSCTTFILRHDEAKPSPAAYLSPCKRIALVPEASANVQTFHWHARGSGRMHQSALRLHAPANPPEPHHAHTPF